MPEISAERVKHAVDNDQVMLLDVRTPHEYLAGHIVGSINIPLHELARSVEHELPEKDSLIYVYCRSGSRSEQAVRIMKHLGYLNVHNMTGGLLAWNEKKYQLV